MQSLYTPFKESLLSQNPSVDLDTDTIKLALVNTGTDYTFSASDQFMSSVSSYSGTTDQTLANKTVAGGVFDNTADITFTAVAIDGSKTVDAVVLYKDTGVAGTSPVIAYFDLPAAITPNGTDIIITPNASGFFAL